MQNRKRDTDVQNRLPDPAWECKGGMFWENSIETSILSRVKQITSPSWIHETNARGWCTGKTQRDGMWREAGGGIGMGNTRKSMADSWQKPLQYCKIISLQLIKINEKKKKKRITNKEMSQVAPLSGKESSCQCRGHSTCGLGRFPGEGNGNPFQYSCLENPRDRGAWWAAACGVA